MTAQRNVLTRDVMLIGATAVVATHNPGVGRRPLRPVDPAVFEGDLLRRVVAGRQSGNERGNLPGLGIDSDDAGAIVKAYRAYGLVRVRSEEPPALETFLERDVDRRAVRQETYAARRGLGERATDPVAALIKHQDVGREGVGGRQLAPDQRTRLVVAPTRQAVPRLQHEHLKPASVAAKRDGSREVQAALEDRNREARRHDDIFAITGVEEDVLAGTDRISSGLGCCKRRQGKYQRE